MDGDAKRRRDRRPPTEVGSSKRTLSISQLCSEVAYFYRLTPKEVADFSCQQLLMWYETALEQVGLEKDLDLEISIAPHVENPDRTIKQLRTIFASFGKTPK
jgi:hypothetical protein